MSTRFQLRRVFLIVAAAAALNGVIVNGCSCVGPITVYNSYFSDSATNVFRAKVIRELKVDGCDPDEDQSCSRFYQVRLKKTFKGCPLPRKFVLSTGANSAICGISVSRRDDFVFFSSLGFAKYEDQDTYGVFSCQAHTSWNSLDRASQKFLNGREYTCDGKKFCANGKHQRLLLRCATGCRECSDSTAVCDSSLCRGCGVKGSFYYNPETFEPLSREECRA